MPARLVLLLVGLFCSVPALAQSYRVTNLNVGPARTASLASGFLTVGDTAYFTLWQQATNTALWSTDGTPEGTTLVADVMAGPGLEGTPQHLASFLGSVYFVASGGDGPGLWRTTGTPASTRLVRTFGSITRVVPCGGKLFLTGRDAGEWHDFLWTSDGTEAGTRKVGTVWVSTSAPLCQNATGTLLFFGTSPETGTELWTSKGTDETTQLVEDLTPGEASTYFLSMAWMNGTTALFGASTPSMGYELWRTDGTAQGTYPFADIVPGPDSSYPSNFTPMGGGGGVLFGAQDATGMRLMRTDGVSVNALASFTNGPGPMVPAGGTTYFTAATAASGLELWRTDGATAVQVADLTGGSQGTVFGPMAFVAGKLWFWANKTLYRLDGTTLTQLLTAAEPPPAMTQLGTSLIFSAVYPQTDAPVLFLVDTTAEFPATRPLWRPAASTAPASIVPLAASGSQALFSAFDGLHGTQLWRTDGTEAGTESVVEPCRGTGSPIDAAMPVAGGRNVFVAYDCTPEDASNARRLLFSTDGVTAAPLSTTYLNPTLIGHLNERAVFTASVNGQSGLGLTDGTSAGTSIFRWMSATGRAATLGDRLIFYGYDGSSGAGSELWMTDGTSEGTVLLKDLNPGTGQSNANQFTRAGSVVYFVATHPTYGAELWKTDGTTDGTTLVADLTPGSAGSSLSNLTGTETTLFFAKSSTDSGLEIWKSDGSEQGTVLLADIHPGETSSNPRSLVTLGGSLVFVATHPTYGVELWKSDGTPDGTMLLKDIRPGPESARPSDLLVAGGRLYFAADDGVHGRELWSSDGTAEGTALVADGVPGYLSSAPAKLLLAGDLLYFEGQDVLGDRELWALDLSAPLVAPRVVGTPGDAGWFRSDVQIAFEVQDATLLDTQGCDPATLDFDTEGQTYTCEATSRGGTTTQSVTVRRDATAPRLGCPAAPIVEEATSAAGAAVHYPALFAFDAMDPSPMLVASAASGDGFPLGQTTVSASATDAAGNVGTCSFSVKVEDTLPPNIACADVQVEAAYPAGAVVDFAATAVDAADPAPQLAYSAVPHSTFALGETQVTATARDAAGNDSTCAFRIRVVDTTPPQITCPADRAVETADPNGAAIEQTGALATDAATSSPQVTYFPPTGTTLPVGRTAVLATATDAAGNTAACSFNVAVSCPKCGQNPNASAASDSGCSVAPGAGPFPLAALLALGLALNRRRAR